MANKKKDEKQMIYVGTLYRFGSELTSVGFTEKSVKDALIKEYIDTYKKENGCHPSEDEHPRWGGTFLSNAYEDIEIMLLEVGKVEWR